MPCMVWSGIVSHPWLLIHGHTCLSHIFTEHFCYNICEMFLSDLLITLAMFIILVTICIRTLISWLSLPWSLHLLFGSQPAWSPCHRKTDFASNFPASSYVGGCWPVSLSSVRHLSCPTGEDCPCLSSPPVLPAPLLSPGPEDNGSSKQDRPVSQH